VVDVKMDEQNEKTARDSERARMSQINMALGIFVCFFGFVVLFSIFFTETTVGMMTNLGAGLILVVIGVGMIARSKTKSSNS
jgi:hypothetical protein